MRIPDFLRPENKEPIDPKTEEMLELQEKYKEQFGDYPTTEPSVYSVAEWIRFLNECLEKNITVFELLSGELENDSEREYGSIIIIE